MSWHIPRLEKTICRSWVPHPAIILEWLAVSRDLIVLSNNSFKLGQLRNHGFEVTRVKSVGRISAAGKREAIQRGSDFDHLDMDGEELTFDQELQRLKAELSHKQGHVC